jgi:hypothetical protein
MKALMPTRRHGGMEGRKVCRRVGVQAVCPRVGVEEWRYQLLLVGFRCDGLDQGTSAQVQLLAAVSG